MRIKPVNMNEQIVLAIGLGTLVATTLMTIFSYVIGRLRNRQFTEPVLLNHMLYSFRILREDQVEKNLTGWIIHYFIGLLFLIAYYLIWSESRIDPTLRTAFMLGCVSGLVGIVGWSIMFRIRSAPPNIKVSEYFAQLFVAHIIFALTATALYRLVT
jgi:hypothetical protein